MSLLVLAVALYFLKHGELVKDSTQLVVEVRNPKTGLVEKRISLYPRQGL
jgi:hypothetical protein